MFHFKKNENSPTYKANAVEIDPNESLEDSDSDKGRTFQPKGRIKTRPDNWEMITPDTSLIDKLTYKRRIQYIARRKKVIQKLINKELKSSIKQQRGTINAFIEQENQRQMEADAEPTKLVNKPNDPANGEPEVVAYSQAKNLAGLTKIQNSPNATETRKPQLRLAVRKYLGKRRAKKILNKYLKVQFKSLNTRGTYVTPEELGADKVAKQIEVARNIPQTGIQVNYYDEDGLIGEPKEAYHEQKAHYAKMKAANLRGQDWDDFKEIATAQMNKQKNKLELEREISETESSFIEIDTNDVKTARTINVGKIDNVDYLGDDASNKLEAENIQKELDSLGLGSTDSDIDNTDSVSGDKPKLYKLESTDSDIDDVSEDQPELKKMDSAENRASDFDDEDLEDLNNAKHGLFDLYW